MPQNGCEPSPSLRAQLLRKVALYKLLVRYPSLRIATLEHERSAEGRPTGHKLSVLYRLTADIDPLGERIAAPAAANITQLRAAGRFVRPVDSEAKPASIPALLVPAPRIPLCTPGANMEPGSTVTMKPRSGGSSSRGRRSAEMCSSISSKAFTNPAEVHETPQASRGTSDDGKASQETRLQAERIQSIRSSILEGTRQLLGQGFTDPRRDVKPFDNSANGGDERSLAHASSAVQAAPVQANSRPYLSSQAPNSGEGGGVAAGGAGDFESKIARAIHWLHQKKQCDRSLFAARTKSARRYTVSPRRGAGNSAAGDSSAKNGSSSPTNLVAEGPKKTLLSVLCQGLPQSGFEDTAVGEPSAEASQAEGSSSVQNNRRFETLGSSSFAGWPSANAYMNEPQKPAQWCATAFHSSGPRTPLLQGQTIGHFTISREHRRDGEAPSRRATQQNSSQEYMRALQQREASGDVPSHVPDSMTVSYVATPTLLEAQFARDLARDYMRPMAPVSADELRTTAAPSHGWCSEEFEGAESKSAGLPCNVRHRTCQNALQAKLDQSSACSSPQADRVLRTSMSRRHSIITLHPRQDGTMMWNSFQTMNSELGTHGQDTAGWPGDCHALAASGATMAYEMNSPSQRLGSRLPVDSKGKMLHRQEPIHRTERQGSPRAGHADVRTFGRLDMPEGDAIQQLWGSVTPDQSREARKNLTPTAAHRSSSLGALRERGLLSMKERVAFFEDRLSRHQARMEAEAQSLARKQRTSQRHGMLWPSRRGPLRLEAIYKIRLPLIVDESGTPWGRTPIIGPGKPENQNHAIAFSRMDTMQVMDMNMESYLEEAIKLRNLLQEFVLNARMRILGTAQGRRAAGLSPNGMPGSAGSQCYPPSG